MNVSSYDTNTGDWRHDKFETALRPCPEAALAWLCEDNEVKRDETPPIGPVKFSRRGENFILVSAWTMGRQWFDVLAIFSESRLPDGELTEILEESGIDTDADDEDYDEEDVDDEEEEDE